HARPAAGPGRPALTAGEGGRMSHSEALVLPRPTLVRDLVALTKPGITGLVLCTTAGGFLLAPNPVAWPSMLLTLIATAAIVRAANALNCYVEPDVDAKMERTRNRPLPAHRLDPRVALTAGIALACISLPVLVLAAGPLAATLALFAFFSYVFLYTPLKL